AWMTGCVLAVAAVAGIAVFVTRSREGAQETQEATGSEGTKATQGAQGAQGTEGTKKTEGAQGRTAMVVSQKKAPTQERPERSAVALDERLQAAMDDGDFDRVHAIAWQAMQDDDHDLLEALPMALGIFGTEAILTLRQLRRNANREVAAAAAQAWADVVQDVEDSDEKSDLLGDLDEMLDPETFDDVMATLVVDTPKVALIERLLPYIAGDDPEMREKALEWHEFILFEEYVNDETSRRLAREQDAE
ncbi:MAG: hypothetical protein FWF84_07965, partial [Kiritimatiellaeota bacterium]|nr:hypothetical protein [Kiritimatiellota bacterium]